MTSLELINLTLEDKIKGVWISGDKINGEYMSWHDNGNLRCHYFHKNGELNRDFKLWYSNGILWFHGISKNGKIIEEII